MQPFFIGSYDELGGLNQYKKPFKIPDQAFSDLENAYIYRDRVKKREGLRLVGRLKRNIPQSGTLNFFTTGNSPWNFNINVVTGFVATANNANPGQVTTTYPHGLTTGDKVIISNIVGATGYNNVVFTITVVDTLNFTVGVNAAGFGAYISGGQWISNRSISATEPDATIVPGSVEITLATGPVVLIDQGNGTLETSPVSSTSGTINYVTGAISITHSVGSGVDTTISYSYYPGLSSMGIWGQQTTSLNDENTIFFDQRYAYIFNGTIFQEFIPGTSWDASDNNFFLCTNYRGANAQNNIFFATNFLNDATDPMRYVSGSTWNTFQPQVDATPNYLFQAKILIPYYGRLVALNTIEGPNIAGAVNIKNRARASAVGSPLASTAWRTDLYGEGIFVDAPTSEAIVAAKFFKNTLIVRFERSTWQLRYVGEYGIPFIWERISSDFGGNSTFSDILFDQGIIGIGNRAITSSNSITVDRVDLQIPDFVFNILNANSGTQRVWGVRDFQRELVFWCYPNSEGSNYFPNRVLVYNYRNQTYSIFRDNVTCFGTLQISTGVTWSDEEVFWEDEDVLWDEPDNQSLFPLIVSGNQQGFIHEYGYKTPDDPSLQIMAVNLTASPTPVSITVPNHNLETGDIVYLTGTLFTPSDPGLNNQIYRVVYIDNNTLYLTQWVPPSGSNPGQYANVYSSSMSTYIGGGLLTLFPQLYVQTKDFNPYQSKGLQLKLIRVDFLTDCTPSAEMSVQVFLNAGDIIQGNLLVGNQEVETYLQQPYYPTTSSDLPDSDLSWHRFYCPAAGQYVRIVMTYDDSLMNQLSTHQQTWVLNAMNLWMRPGGKIIF